jgi:hypothetical protein
VPGIWERVADLVYPVGQKYADDPVGWASERAGTKLWSKQQVIICSVRDNPLTAVHSCHNIGKSFTAAQVCAWWIDSHPPGTAFVVTTAPTGAQVKGILWREINRVHRDASLPGRTNLTEWYLGGELVAFGRKPSDTDPTAFQGIHALYVLVILDEACGIPEALWDAASTLTSNDTSRTLAIGNPDDPHSHFAKVCKPGSGWNVIGIGAADSPNWTGEAVPDRVRRSLISTAWAKQKELDWGVSNPLYISKVLGQFPSDSEFGVIQMSKLTQCRLQGPEPEEGERVAGLDVGAGGDRTVLFPRYGNTMGEPFILRKDDAMETVDDLVVMINDWKLERVVVDVIGVGWGVYSRLRQLSAIDNPGGEKRHQARIDRFNGSEKAPKRRKDDPDFLNKRAWIWWMGRDWIRDRAINLEAISDDCAAELVEPKWETKNGKIKVEEKQEIIARLGRSPDEADALLMSLAPGMPVAKSSSQTVLSRTLDVA